MKNYIKEVLLWSQKYTKTDMLYLAKGGFWLGSGQIFGMFSVLALSYVYANYLSQETYGVYKYILSISSIFLIFTLPGMRTALTRASARGYESLIYPVTKFRLKFALLGSLTALLGSSYYFLNGNLQLALAFIIIALSLPIFETFTTYLSYLIGKRRFKENTKFRGIAQTVSFIALLTTILSTDNVLYILIAYFFPISITQIIIYLYITRKISKKIDLMEKTRVFSYGKHLTMISILGVIASNLDKILLWKFFGPAQLATYVFSMAIPDQLKSMLSKVGELAFPKFAAQSSEQITKNLPILMHKILIFIAISFLISFAYILVAPLIFNLFFPQYVESIFFTQIIALSLFTAINVPLKKLLEAQKKTKIQYALETVRPILLAFLFITLIPLYGIIGAVLSYIFARIFYAVASLIAIHILFSKRI